LISVIIPTYNEAALIESALDSLRAVRGDFEVVVADGSSTDGTALRVESLAPGFPRRIRVSVTERNRGKQLNCAAGLATGHVLLFLHADARLPEDALESLECALTQESVVGGNFHLRFEGGGWSRFFTWVDRTRRAFGIYYGDSGLFVRRTMFERLGGFKPIPLMEDYEFIRRLDRLTRRERLKTVCLPRAISVSDRRWRAQGVWRTMWTWFWIQSLYSVGVSPSRLARWYRPVRLGR